MKLYRILSALMLLTLFTIPVFSQEMMNPHPEWNWQTIETDHFRIHFPDFLKDWTLTIAPKMEAIHDGAATFVGYTNDTPIDIIIIDPSSNPNGAAIPIFTYPRMFLGATPTSPDMIFGGLSDWGELVFGHEQTHLIHLLRPPRNSLEKLIAKILPVSSIAMKSPLWAVEGLAVLSESNLTGHGRARSAFRAMLLRQWAREGKLPEFHELSDSGDWLSGSYPYMVGSAYLDWLKNRSVNPDSLVDLWKRLTAKKRRSFEEAFKGVFQDTPEDLYDRFRAEITAKALDVERQVDASQSLQGELWFEHSHRMSRPALSPDGTMMAVALATERKPPALYVWSTQEVAEKKKEKKEITDPEDVPDKPWKPPARKELHKLISINGIRPSNPRWFSDGQSMVFQSPVLSTSGRLNKDLYQWWPETGQLKRLTHGLDLQFPDPFPDMTQIAAVVNRLGKSNLAIYDIKTSTVKNLTEPALEKTYGSPRVSPDGRYIASACWGKDFSEIQIFDLKLDQIRRISASEGNIITFPAWDQNTLIYSESRNGILNLYRMNMETWQETAVTNTVNGVLGAEPDPLETGAVYFTEILTGGMNIRHLVPENHPQQVSPVTITDTDAFPVIPPRELAAEVEWIPSQAVEIKPYGLGPRQEFKLLLSGGSAPSGSGYQAGFRGGDVLGRLEYLALGGLGWNGGVSGGAARVTCRRLPVELWTKVFWNRREPQKQDDYEKLGGDTGLAGNPLLRHDAAGGALGANWMAKGNHWHAGAGISGLMEQIEPEDADRLEKQVAAGGFVAGRSWNYGRLGAFTGVRLNGAAGWTDGEKWQQMLGTVQGSVTPGGITLAANYTLGQTSGDPSVLDLFTGGGWRNSLETDLHEQGKIEIPYLPDRTFQGEKFERLRVELHPGSDSILVAFGEQFRFWTDDEKPDPVLAAGVELRMEIPPISILKMPSASFRAGAVYVFDEPFKDEWKGYVMLRYRP